MTVTLKGCDEHFNNNKLTEIFCKHFNNIAASSEILQNLLLNWEMDLEPFGKEWYDCGINL